MHQYTCYWVLIRAALTGRWSYGRSSWNSISIFHLRFCPQEWLSAASAMPFEVFHSRSILRTSVSVPSEQLSSPRLLVPSPSQANTSAFGSDTSSMCFRTSLSDTATMVWASHRSCDYLWQDCDALVKRLYRCCRLHGDTRCFALSQGVLYSILRHLSIYK